MAVDLWASDRLLGTVRADVYRRGLEETGFGAGKHGFAMRLPEWLKGGTRTWIWANVADTAFPLQRSPCPVERRTLADSSVT